jgi:hypothetical protein
MESITKLYVDVLCALHPYRCNAEGCVDQCAAQYPHPSYDLQHLLSAVHSHTPLATLHCTLTVR